MKKLIFLAPLLILMSACNADSPDDLVNTVDADERGPSSRGKADQPGSCESADGSDFCGQRSADGCWCDDQCTSFGDCCSDRVAVCEAPEEIPGSCEGACGGQSADGCWCDDQCAGFGDCCEDITTVCEEEPEPIACAGNPTYRVAFQATWDPNGVPNPHWSPLIGGSHTSEGQFFTFGGIATDGVEVMAETGAPGQLAAEVSSAVSTGTAGQVLQGSGIDSPGQTSLEFDLDGDHTLVTLVTMMAPSPDWFVGVDSLELCPEGEWATSLAADMVVFDAGTDSGTGFTSPDQNTNPAAPISLATRFVSGGQPVSVGTMVFTRVE